MTGREDDPTLVRCSVANGVATLVLDRPEKLNALLPGTFVALRGHLETLTAHEELDCVVLTGAGRSFSAGVDLAWAHGPPDTPGGHDAAETLDLLEAFPRPTIAKVRGHCLTGGLELALACDLVVCSDDAVFADTHRQVGLVPAWGLTVRLPERVGLAAAREMSLTGRTVTGPRAETIGLASRCVPGPELDGTVEELVREIARGSRDASRIYKTLYAERGRAERTRALTAERSLVHGLPFHDAPTADGFNR